MAEIRKHRTDDDDSLGKLVRDALGERIRPREPGHVSPHVDGRELDEPGDDTSASTLPSWPSEGQSFSF